jgi:hypothetical protein
LGEIFLNIEEIIKNRGHIISLLKKEKEINKCHKSEERPNEDIQVIKNITTFVLFFFLFVQFSKLTIICTSVWTLFYLLTTDKPQKPLNQNQKSLYNKLTGFNLSKDRNVTSFIHSLRIEDFNLLNKNPFVKSNIYDSFYTIFYKALIKESGYKLKTNKKEILIIAKLFSNIQRETIKEYLEKNIFQEENSIKKKQKIKGFSSCGIYSPSKKAKIISI